jgi:hypothetical protein
MAFVLVAGFILAVGVTVRFRVLARHCAPILPLALFLLATGVAALLKRGGWGRLTVTAFVGLSLISCFMLRFSERHAKDEYRGAAALGRQALAQGQTVWWNADREGALIYRLPVANPPGTPNTALFLMSPSTGFERDLPKPDLVLTSKPDVYDNQGALRDYLLRTGFQPVTNLPAFTAWRLMARSSRAD